MSTTLRRHELFIGGEWTPGAGGGAQEIVNPATGKVIAHVPKGTEDDVNRAVAAARKAFDEGWADTTPRERSERMLKLAGAIEANGDELARIESENVGKPLAATRSEEIPPIVDCIRAGPPANTCRASRAWCAASRSASSARSPLGTTR